MEGLTTQAAHEYVTAHGYNEIRDRSESLAHKIFIQSASPISGMLLIASILSFWNGKTFDGGFILVLLGINVAVTAIQEHKADRAIAKLNEHMATSVKALRDGTWQRIPARELAVRDAIELRSGDIVPADARVLEANAAGASEAALTGESLPKEKRVDDTLYSGSFITSGLLTAEVTATGGATYFGATLAKTSGGRKQSSLETDILRISRFLSTLSLAAVALLTWLFIVRHAPIAEVIRLDLSLIIAGIPISLPAVMTLITAYGVIELAKKKVIVRRISSLEDLANTDLLLTDKTGTLTENRIEVKQVLPYGARPEAEVRGLAAAVAACEPDTAINQAVLGKVAAPYVRQIAYVPADSARKRSTLTAEVPQEGIVTLSLGAPQVIAELCAFSADAKQTFYADVDALAARGYRTLALAVARGKAEAAMELAGLFALSDTLREDAPGVIAFLTHNGIDTVMLTGDNRAIAKEAAERLGIPGENVLTREDAPDGWQHLPDTVFKTTRSFAEILPEDKFTIVEMAKRHHTVAVNGDGVNDLPAVKEANVGFAVKNAVDALKAAADIVLLTDGIAVMRDAFIEGRKIFERLYAYSLYRISESFRLIVTIAILGVLTGTYPLSPLQLILIALLNDIPIISLALDRVKVPHRPAKIQVREQFTRSVLYGLVGIVNSMLLYVLATAYLRLPMPVVQTLFFLKLTVSGHLLIYVTHTRERWFRYLPSMPVIAATSVTQAVATALALTGWLMPAPISWQLAVFIWLWSFFFMQVSELMKKREPEPAPSLGHAH